MTVKSGPRSPTRDPHSAKPEITIKPAFKLMRSPTHGKLDSQSPLKVDPSGALNLSTGSPSPELTSPNSSSSPDTSSARISPARSPQGYRPPSYNSVELCVVCGDRASGQISFKLQKLPLCNCKATVSFYQQMSRLWS